MRTFVIIGLVLCLMLASVPAHIKIYKWADEKGKSHFTDDPTKIPKNQGLKLKPSQNLLWQSAIKLLGKIPHQRNQEDFWQNKGSLRHQIPTASKMDCQVNWMKRNCKTFTNSLKRFRKISENRRNPAQNNLEPLINSRVRKLSRKGRN